MISQAAIKIPSDVFHALDFYHQAVAVALQKKGLVAIEEQKAGDA